MSKLSHLDKKGEARMVDVSGKETTARTATAEGFVVNAFGSDTRRRVFRKTGKCRVVVVPCGRQCDVPRHNSGLVFFDGREDWIGGRGVVMGAAERAGRGWQSPRHRQPPQSRATAARRDRFMVFIFSACDIE